MEQTNISGDYILQTEEESTDHSFKILRKYCLGRMGILIVDNYPYYFKLLQEYDSENTDLHNIHPCTALSS